MMLYAITRRDGKWMLARNKRVAVRIARAMGGKVYVRPDVIGMTVWDWPTFIGGAEKIYGQ